MKPFTTVASVVAAALIVASGVNCNGTTGDHRLRFGGTVRGSGSDGVTARGWSLHFEQFIAAFGPVRVYSDQGFTAALTPASIRSPLHWFTRFSVGIAHAQHCHGCPRAPLAEFGFEGGGAVFKPVDLLAAAPFSLGPANARNGHYRSVSFTFISPVSFDDGGIEGTALGGHSMVVRGTASRGGVEIPFEGAIDLDVLRYPSAANPAVLEERPYSTYGVLFDERPDGVFIDHTNEMTDHVAIRVELPRMFGQADFATLPEPSIPGAPRVIAADTQVYRAWRLGVEDPRTFRVGWVGDGGNGEPAPASPERRDAGTDS